MLTYSIVKESSTDDKDRRELKVVQFGAKTANVVSSFGEDSHPLENMIAIYANTSEKGDNVVLGYINTNQIAAIGEKRLFSLMEDGSLSFSIHLKNDGTCEIGGDGDFAVRFNKLQEQFDQLVTDFNNHVHNTTATVGPGPTPGTITPPTVPSTADISAAKIEEIKVPG